MNKLSAYAFAAVMALGTTAMLANSNHAIQPGENTATSLDADGAFRDGLYLGKLTAQNREPMRVDVGRWSTEQDRESFASGYRLGYQEGLVTLKP